MNNHAVQDATVSYMSTLLNLPANLFTCPEILAHGCGVIRERFPPPLEDREPCKVVIICLHLPVGAPIKMNYLIYYLLLCMPGQ